MKDIISTIIFILTSTAIASACGQCVVKEHMNEFGFGNNNDSHNARQHKVKVKMVHMSYGDEICSYLFFDRDQNLMLEDHRMGEQSYYKRYQKVNGKIKLAEKIERSGSSSEYIYSEDGKLLTSRVQSVAGIIEYFFLDNGKEYLSRKSASPLQNKKISYKYTYYDQNGNDTAIVSYDKNHNITHRTRKIYNQQGRLTEVYENDSLTEHYKLDSTGIPIADSSKTNRSVSSKYEEAGGKATYEYEDGTLSGKNWEISRDQQEEILTEMEGDKIDSVTGKLRIDTTVTRTTYGSDGKVLLRKISVNSKVKYIDRYTYNGRGQLLSIQSNGRHRTSEHVKDYIWDTETDKVTYQYDGKHRLISEVTTCGKQIVKQITYRYDAANHLISKVTKTPDKYNDEEKYRLPVPEVVTILYDKIGNPTKRTISYRERSKNIFEETIFLRYIYYDE